MLVGRPDGLVDGVLDDQIGIQDLAPGVSWVELLHPGSRDKARRFLMLVCRDGAALGWELTAPLPSGPEILSFAGAGKGDRLWVAASRRPSDLAAHYPYLLELAGVDATGPSRWAGRDFDEYDELSRLHGELANLHREALDQNRQLERVLRERNELLGVVAHDLRTPIAVLQLGCGFLQRESASLPPDHRRLIADMTTACATTNRMIEQLLNYSRIQAGHLELHRTPVDLPALAAHVVRRHDILGMQRGVHVVLAPSSSLPPVPADATRIEEVLDNLIGNAVKFSPDAATVEVSVRRADGQVAVAVRDHGPGIPDEDQARLFEPFTKGSIAPASGAPGAGLGLAIVAKIIRGHGGSIQYDSALGQGTTVTVGLPLGGPSPDDET